MNNNGLLNFFESHPHCNTIVAGTRGEGKAKFSLQNLQASAAALFAASCFEKYNETYLFVLDDKEEAAYFYNDLLNAFSAHEDAKKKILFFPSAYKRSVQYSKPDSANIVMRTEVLSRLGAKKNSLVISYPEALLEKVITHNKLISNTLQVNIGDAIGIDFLVEVLVEYEFERVDFVYEAGQYAVRGSIVDIFSFSNDYPFRVDFFGDEVETIRTFDIVNQLSKARLDQIAIIPDIQSGSDENRESFLKFISPQSLIWLKDTHFLVEKLDALYSEIFTKSENELHKNQIVSGKELFQNLYDFSVVEFSDKPAFEPKQVLHFKQSPQLDFNKDFNLLAKNLAEKHLQGYTNYFLSENEKQIERLESIFQSIDNQEDVKFFSIQNIIHTGFIEHDLKICFYTDHQIFKRYHKFQLKDSRRSEAKQAITLQEIHGLQPGDYVVHVDHGVGQFGGLQKVEINGKMQESIRLIYKNKDVLFVSIHSLHRIAKYRGKEGIPPKLHKLGSKLWQRLKTKTKSKVKDIAKELIALYAKRKQQQGFSFSADSYMQDELESSFMYEDTPDQLKATIDVKRDMENFIPMDRLVCGDVGFGKTEIAVRAAFKAVADNKQVAVLVPTTILALQHAKTFEKRLHDFPCTVDYISRLKTTKAQRETLKKLAEGKIDIIIGTHRLIGKDVIFKDLGLLIIDEEQKFGVAVKEKLKHLKLNVDTLTLTATPIPRTLQFSLMGARDLSLIHTPPPNRYPILTELLTFNEDAIRDAINYEIERNGQVFFVNNRVQNIYEIEALINRICPTVRTVVAHGQMEGKKLEKIMLDFISEEYGVLIATTIIESGLDIPNANTIIINNAQNFGLGDLHQLRGRVGRSNKKAFCYLLSPPLSSLTPEARRRLKAISNFSELGSGFNISLQDLDIRGAGNMLGGEQSGFIADIGFETYQRILNEAIVELRENEYQNILSTEENPEEKLSEMSFDVKYVSDCHIDTDLQLLFTDEYIANISERVKLYRQLDNIETEENLSIFRSELIDRFGNLPKSGQELLEVVRLRWLAIDLGIEKIILKNRKMILYFVSKPESPFYESETFGRVLQYVQKHQQKCQMKQQNGKLSLVFKQIAKIKSAIQILKSM